MLEELIGKCADQCERDGVAIDGECGGAIHQWVMQNCTHRPGTEFFIVFLLTCELANREARRQGFADQYDRAAKRMHACQK